MMRVAFVAGVIAVVLLAAVRADEQLSDVQKLKAENFQLKVQIAQLRATLADRETRLASIELSVAQAALVAEFRQTLQADPEAEFDWTRLEFHAPTKETK